MIIVVSYLVFLLVFFVLSRIIAVRKYAKAQEQLKTYSNLLKKLEQSYKEEKNPFEDQEKEGRQ